MATGSIRKEKQGINACQRSSCTLHYWAYIMLFRWHHKQKSAGERDREEERAIMVATGLFHFTLYNLGSGCLNTA
jgi:hypothetical protein